MNNFYRKGRAWFFMFLFLAQINPAVAQTDIDGLMMKKGFFCVGPTVGKSSWKKYWEGTNKRENENLGTVSTSKAMIMGNYGITRKLNFLFNVPYYKTKASAGQLAGQKGFQDLSLFLKWVAYEKRNAGNKFSVMLIGGYSTPLSNYTPDLLPLSIGLHSRTGMLRLMLDQQWGHWFVTGSGTYMLRDNVKLDRDAYYTTEMHYTNEVKMPNASYLNLRGGYRSPVWILEAVVEQFNTLGGYDISKNNMPFISNEMNFTRVGAHVKYETSFIRGLSLVADVSTTVAGRNVGQATGFDAGIFYIMDFGKKTKSKTITTP